MDGFLLLLLRATTFLFSESQKVNSTRKKELEKPKEEPTEDISLHLHLHKRESLFVFLKINIRSKFRRILWSYSF